MTPAIFPELSLVLVFPDIHCSTGKVFQSLELGKTTPQPVSQMLEALAANDPEKIARALFNRLEEASFKLWPQLGVIRDRLLELGCLGAMMSGSGSTIFGIARNPAQAKEIASCFDKALPAQTQRR